MEVFYCRDTQFLRFDQEPCRQTEKKVASYSDKLRKKYGRVTFGRFLASWRESEEMTQVQFAKKLGLPEKGLVAMSLQDSLHREGMEYSVELTEVA